ncbi:MAG TPA: MBOAT family O-acyltransferase [Roseiarcus sp.]|nr:MBOAT family O-acyltransferase [Roseiarcus sp.]
MLFPTIEFGFFFAFTFALAWTFQNQNLVRKAILLGLSLFFYASWNPKFVLLILAIGSISFLAGSLADASRPKTIRACALFVGVCLNLLILIYFKYLDFIAAQFYSLSNWIGVPVPEVFVDITLPVAISFMVFHSISYISDVHSGKMRASSSPLDIFLYISFFPHLVAGPIVRANDFLPQLEAPADTRGISLDENCLLILGGLFKKMVIANYLAVNLVDPVFTDPSQFSRWDLTWAAYGYAVQIYADFSGYTDIAIGIAALLGYRFPQNFNQPYRAIGVGDFWRRWHITLSNWLRDYLYIPLGGNRRGALHTVRNLMVTMVLGGLWHGANWTFLIWGFLHGAALVVDHGLRQTQTVARLQRNPLARAAAWAATFHFVCFAWIFFRAPSLDVAGQFLSGLWTDNGAAGTAPWIVFPLIACGALTQVLPADARTIVGRMLDGQGRAVRIGVNFVLLYGLLVMAPSRSAPFIYFQF